MGKIFIEDICLSIRNLCDIFLCVKWAAILRFHVVLFIVSKGKTGKEFPKLMDKGI